MSMSQEELQKLLDEFGQSKIAQTPKWKIDNANRFREIRKYQYDMPHVKKSRQENAYKLGKSNKGNVVDESVKKRISYTLKGRVITEEHASKISKSLKGKEKSEEHKKNLSKSRMGIKCEHTSKRNTEMNSKKFKCKYCNREIGGLANYKRFHDDNCKMKK